MTSTKTPASKDSAPKTSKPARDEKGGASSGRSAKQGEKKSTP